MSTKPALLDLTSDEFTKLAGASHAKGDKAHAPMDLFRKLITDHSRALAKLAECGVNIGG